MILQINQVSSLIDKLLALRGEVSWLSAMMLSLCLFLSLTTRASCFFCLSSSRSRTFLSVRRYVIEGREKKGFVPFSFEKECLVFFWEGNESGRRTSVRFFFVRCCFSWLLECLVFCFDIHDHTHNGALAGLLQPLTSRSTRLLRQLRS